MEKELSRLTRLIQAEILAWDHTILAQFSEMQFRFEALLERPSHLSSIYRLSRDVRWSDGRTLASRICECRVSPLISG